MFHFPQFPHTWLFYSPCCTWACPHVGFPIRTSPDLAAAHTSPELFAVYRVLLRHLTPQAFTVRPCSFSTAPCCVDRVLLVCWHHNHRANSAFLSMLCSDYALGKEPPRRVCPASRCIHLSAAQRLPLRRQAPILVGSSRRTTTLRPCC